MAYRQTEEENKTGLSGGQAGAGKTDKLQIHDLCVDFATQHGTVHAVKGVTLTAVKGRITALVGESGSGKSVTSLAVMDLLARNGRIASGRILYGSRDLLTLPERERRKLNGTVFSMIFQDPSGSLDPLFTIEDQMEEGILAHRKISRREARCLCLEYLRAVNLRDPETLLRARPHELSGGMCQRVMIAIAMALQPDFLIADEPTTALDVTVQKQILKKIWHLSREQGMGVLFITHDLGVVAEIADDVCIMQKGMIVENGPVLEIFEHPRHPYTRTLLQAIM